MSAIEAFKAKMAERKYWATLQSRPVPQHAPQVRSTPDQRSQILSQAAAAATERTKRIHGNCKAHNGAKLRDVMNELAPGHQRHAEEYRDALLKGLAQCQR